jgi:peptide/nickel transport system permease protein
VLIYIAKRIVYTLPILLGVALVCFALVHMAPGDPLVSVLPPDATEDLKRQMMVLYGFDRPYYEQFFKWLARAATGDLGTSIRTSRPVVAEVWKAVGNTFMLATMATFIGFVLGTLFGFVAGYFRDTWIDKSASFLSVIGVSVPHYWLGMMMVAYFAAYLQWLPPTGAGPGGGLEVGLGTRPPHDPAGHHHERDPHGHHCPHDPRACG